MRETADQPYTLAIETSGRVGAVVLGVTRAGGTAEIAGQAEVAPPPRQAHKRVNLVPAIAQLCQAHEVAPATIGAVYVSIGPGSFTGLRNAVTTAKMLALVHGTRIVAVPTCDAVAHAAAVDGEHLAVCLNTKRDQMYSVVYRRDDTADGGWCPVVGPGLFTAAELTAQAPSPLIVLGDHLPEVAWPEGVTLADLPAAAMLGQSVWTLGQGLAGRGQFTDPLKLLPLYARKPEAVALWDAKQTAADPQKRKT